MLDVLNLSFNFWYELVQHIGLLQICNFTELLQNLWWKIPVCYLFSFNSCQLDCYLECYGYQLLYYIFTSSSLDVHPVKLHSWIPKLYHVISVLLNKPSTHTYMYLCILIYLSSCLFIYALTFAYPYIYIYWYTHLYAFVHSHRHINTHTD